MSLETHIASSEDRLLEGLHFGSRNTASYVISRQNTSFHPSSASAWRPSGVRLARFNLADQSGWLDGGTLRLIFTLTNLNAGAVLIPDCDSPASMFRRVRVICNGSSVIEDIEEYGRTFQMFAEMMPSHKRYNAVTEAWGSTTNSQTLNVPFTPEAIPADSSRQVVVHLMSPFFSQGKWVPLSMLPLTVELELDDAKAAFTGTANSWEITRPRLVADVCEIDQTLQNSYSKHLLEGKSLPMYFPGIYSVKAAVPTGSSLYSLPLARGFTRLSTIYVSFWDGASGTKWVNRFTHPGNGEQNITINDALSYNFTIGAQRFPQFDCESTQECWYRLRMAAAAHLGHADFSISGGNYRQTKFIIGQSLEKAPGMSAHTGINTRSGSQLTLNFRNLGASTMIHVVLIYEQVLSLSAAGTEVLD